MVERSTINYEQHKKDVHEAIKSKVGEKKADIFLKHYSDRYDKYKRSFIDYKLAYALMDDYYYCKNIGTKWYAFVGVGGMGKSTLAKNVLFFLDKEFELKHSATDMREFVKIVSLFKDEDKLRAAYLDEPDDTITSHSSAGKKLRQIFGKIRQQHLFLGICATDLTDIPLYIYRKLDGIFFMPNLGKGMYFKNRPAKMSYALQEIRKIYQFKGYKTFYQVRKTEGCLLFDTQKATPIDYQEKQYLKNKRADYEKNIKEFLGGNFKDITERDKEIIKMKSKGKSTTQIAEIMGISDRRIRQILRELGESEAET